MPSKIIRIATRNSPLALWQAHHVQQQLLSFWPSLTIELVPMVTSGDNFLKSTLQFKGGKGLFVKELEEALLGKRADLAVHSTKDMPAHLPLGLALSAICERDNPFDALVSPNFKSLDELPRHAIVGTASLRRQAQLLAYRPDLQIKTLRGNIHTRLTKLQSGTYDAIILAAAGLERMNLQQHISAQLPDKIMLPSCAQGALCIETRTEDAFIQELIAPLHHSPSALCVATERHVNEQLGGNCHVPLAVFCTIEPNQDLYLQARLFNLDGSISLSYAGQKSQQDSILLANECARSLFGQGAATLLEPYQ